MRRPHPSRGSLSPTRHTLRLGLRTAARRCCACSPTSGWSRSMRRGQPRRVRGAGRPLPVAAARLLPAHARPPARTRRTCSRRSSPPPTTRCSPTSAQINVRPWLYRIARNRSLNHLRRAQAIGVDSMDIHLSEHGADDRGQGPPARGLPPAHRPTSRSCRDAAHRAAAARDRRALLRADRRGDGDHGPVGEVAARPGPRLAGRGGRGAHAHLRGGPRRARRGRRGPAPHHAAVRRHMRTCDRCAAFRKQLRRPTGRSPLVFPVGPLLLFKKVLLAHARA